MRPIPERPQPPSLPGTLNDILARERALERRQLALALESGIPLQTFEDGRPLGDTRFLDFGPGIQATLTGDGFVTVSGVAPGGDGGWDAICDMTLSASDPSNRLFRGIGEALMWLRGTAGYTERAFVLVRKHPTSTLITTNRYQETADVTSIPNQVFLFSTSPYVVGSCPIWDHNGFNVDSAQWYIKGLAITGKQSGAVSATKTALFSGGANGAILEDCFLEPGAMTASSGRYVINSGNVVLICCEMVNGWFAFSSAYDSDLRIFTPGTYDPSNGTVFRMLDCRLDTNTVLSGAVTWNLPVRTIMRVQEPVSFSGGGVNPTFHLGAASGRYSIRREAESMSWHITSAAGILFADLSGYLNDVTLVAPAAGYFHRVFGRVSALDLTGPAVIDVSTADLLKFRGFGGSGHVTTRRAGGSGGTAVDFIAAETWNIDVATGAVPGAGTTKSYAFDAASALNILDFAGASTFPVAGTDAGAGNLIRVT